MPDGVHRSIRWRSLAVPPLLLSLVLTGCGTQPSAGPEPAPHATAPLSVPSSAPDPATQAAALVAKLSDEDLVGQVLMPYAYGASATDVSAGSKAGNQELAGVDTPAQMVEKYRLGGVILVGFSADDPTGKNQPTTNVDNPAQVRALTTGLQDAQARLAAGAAPMLIGTDQEYGVVTRIRNGVSTLPGAMAFGAAGDVGVTEKAWAVAGGELAAMGVNVDFAPVADVLGGPGGLVIGSRSYGDDPKAVAEQVAAAVRGLQTHGVAAALKHFPGHGHTTADSHDTLPVLTQDRKALDAGDLPPFRAGIESGAQLVMSGHLDVRAIDPGVPATFSKKVLTDLLRGELKFEGVVVSDALNMEPAMAWPAGEAAVRALNAGNDLLLMPPDLPAARDGLLAALRDGSLSRERLTEAVTRVLTLRFTLARAEAPPMSTVGATSGAEPLADLARRSVTVLRGGCDGAAVAGPVTVTVAGDRAAAKKTLEDALRAAGVEVAASGGRTTVHLVGYGDGAADLSPGAQVTVAMDLPYVLASASSPTLLATYSPAPAQLTALAAVLAGKAKPEGTSPVEVDGLSRTTC
ncbi:glycoside hydrolase family 3 protein [Catenuloplanes atrovinosus]|uniref:glycoside hydrolase family 3 protein n=1 Tax=Catenuloplanes atrovinosus TaxID=137266 RepID=UPI00286C7F39|nr:glycoside hydrolase family 3 N-terminal domain-containing protein [Catenuloplanes atrovinosus]